MYFTTLSSRKWNLKGAVWTYTFKQVYIRKVFFFFFFFFFVKMLFYSAVNADDINKHISKNEK